MLVRTYSTKWVAGIVGINRVTLQRWLLSGKLAEPRRISSGGVDLRIWTDRDVERVRKYKAANYRKGRGRKPKRKR
jgi:predicted site-specific integrase-resolvase